MHCERIMNPIITCILDTTNKLSVLYIISYIKLHNIVDVFPCKNMKFYVTDHRFKQASSLMLPFRKTKQKQINKQKQNRQLELIYFATQTRIYC